MAHFPSLSADPSLARRLAAVSARGLPQAVILSGGSDKSRRALALELASAMECSSAEPPCGVCSACSKVLRGIHPDVSFVETDKQFIPIDAIRAMRADAYIRPNEGQRKVYIIAEAARLSEADSNALLKIIEEPPAYAAFMLLAECSDCLLATVRSRCVEFALAPDAEAEADDGGLSDELCAALKKGDKLALLSFFTLLERDKKKRELLPALPGAMRQKLSRAMSIGESDPLIARLGVRKALELCDVMQNVEKCADLNVGAAHIIGFLSVKCIGALR